MKYDGEKVRLDLLPVAPLLGVGKVLTRSTERATGRRGWIGADVMARRSAISLRGGTARRSTTKHSSII